MPTSPCTDGFGITVPRLFPARVSRAEQDTGCTTGPYTAHTVSPTHAHSIQNTPTSAMLPMLARVFVLDWRLADVMRYRSRITSANH